MTRSDHLLHELHLAADSLSRNACALEHDRETPLETRRERYAVACSVYSNVLHHCTDYGRSVAASLESMKDAERTPA